MRVCLISFSRIEDDPRVRRQGDALAADGHDVVAVGDEGAASPPPLWPVVRIPARGSKRSARVVGGARALSARASARTARSAFWLSPRHRAFYDRARLVEADVYHANDYGTLPIAARLARTSGGRFVYDSHEYAVEELLDDRLWRLLMPPYVRALEGAHIHQAAFVSTVGDGIADLMQRDYGLPTRPLVIRNVPRYQEMPFRPAGEQLTVLYHGAYNRDRGLDQLVRSVPLWEPRFRLVMRGFGPPGVEEGLRAAAAASGAGDRVTFEQPVPMSELVEQASKADIGIHPIPGLTSQTKLCLPNKFFEYVMAGLALCVSDVPEMARLLERHRLGKVIAESTPEEIARTVNAFTTESVNQHKRAALVAARQLSWDAESAILTAAYERLASDASTAGPRNA